MISRILVVELLGGFGDLIIALPAIHALAAAHPGAELEVATAAPGDVLLAADPAVEKVHVVDPAGVAGLLADRRPDLVVTTTRHSDLPDVIEHDAARRGTRAVTDLWRGPPPDERVGDRFLRLLRREGLVTTAPPDDGVVLTRQERAEGARCLTGHAPGPGAPVVLVPDAGMAVKRWPGHRWAPLAAVLAARGHPVLAVSAEIPRAALLPPLGLRALGGLFGAVAERGGVAVGPDTGPMRLAAAVGAATVALFGPTVAGRYGLAGRGHGADLQGFPGCPVRRPEAITEQRCWWHAACPFSPDGPLCLAELDPGRVVTAVRRHAGVSRTVPTADPGAGTHDRRGRNVMGYDVTQVQKTLAGFDYPGSPDDLARHAQQHGAESDLVEILKGLDKNQFDGPNAVMAALSEHGALGQS